MEEWKEKEEGQRRGGGSSAGACRRRVVGWGVEEVGCQPRRGGGGIGTVDRAALVRFGLWGGAGEIWTKLTWKRSR
jgi:hypothetical protein